MFDLSFDLDVTKRLPTTTDSKITSFIIKFKIQKKS